MCPYLPPYEDIRKWLILSRVCTLHLAFVPVRRVVMKGAPPRGGKGVKFSQGSERESHNSRGPLRGG